MGSVILPTYLDASGTRRTSKTWRMKYRAADGRQINVSTGVKDERAARELLRLAELREDRIRAGLPVPEQGHGHKPLADVVEAWVSELTRLGRDATYVSECRRLVEAVIASTGWTVLSSVTPAGLRDHLAAFADGRASHTVNDHRRKMVSLMNFAVDQDWLARNPLARVKAAPITKRSNPRRAPTPDELAKLLAVATAYRRQLYTVAATSGLRRKELRLLEKQDCDPTAVPPVWRLRPAMNKSRRVELLPMMPECAAALRDTWLAAKLPTTRLFPIIPDHETFNRDVKRAGVEKRDASGRDINPHSLRYFFATELGKRLPIQLVSKLLRHSNISITCKIYLDLGIADMAESVQSLPAILPAWSNSGKSGERMARKRRKT